MILAMDGGGTKTQFLLSDAQGRVVAEHRAEGSNYLQTGLKRLAKIISEGTAQLCQTAQAIQLAVLGIPAYGESRNDSREIELMVRRVLSVPHIIVNDVKLAWAGALACRPGIVVLSGTGSMAYAVDCEGRDWRAGGWGHYFGDEGSAFWLGQKCCALFGKMADGRSPKGPLYRIVRRELGLTDDFELIHLIAQQKDERKETAALARLLFRAATEGDSQAQELFQEAGAELAATVIAVARQIAVQFALQTVPVSYAGGSFAAGELLLAPLRCELERAGLSIQEPVLDSALGAALYGAQTLGWELQPYLEALLEYQKNGNNR